LTGRTASARLGAVRTRGPARVRATWIYIAIVGILLLPPLLMPRLVAPFDPTEFVSEDPFGAVTWSNLLGTDYLGRDLLSRLIDSTRITLLMAFSATLIAHLIGNVLGLVAAFTGGWVDAVLGRIVELVLALPKVVVGLVVVAAIGSSVTVIVSVTGLVYAANVFRIARALGRDIRRQDFIAVAEARGEGLGWLILSEARPHLIAPLTADFALRISFAILFMSSLSFLGLGVQPPLADWGGLVRENLGGLSSGSYAPIYPALAIALTSVALNLLVDLVDERRSDRARIE
jgi:peptide/nickel transport system permease protein